MKIIDTFMFHNEYDILEIRLSEHYDHVDQFAIIEPDRTYTGIYKGFNFEKNKERYDKWKDKINYIKVENCPEVENPLNPQQAWANEYWQRDHMSLAWKNLDAEDVILYSDCDEIFRPEALDFIRNSNYGFYEIMMPGFYFKFNYMDTKEHYSPWGKAYRGYQTQARYMRDMKKVPGKSKVTVQHGGWHFGWFGNEDFIKNKLQSFSHAEFNLPYIIENIDVDKHISEGRDHIRPQNKTWRPVKVNEYFPKTITDNLEKYSQFIINDADKDVRDYWLGNILDINE